VGGVVCGGVSVIGLAVAPPLLPALPLCAVQALAAKATKNVTAADQVAQ